MRRGLSRSASDGGRDSACADVLFVHPAVEGPDAHEPAVGVRPGGRHGDGVPRRVDHLGEHRSALGRHVTEPAQHVGAGLATHVPHPALVHLADAVADVVERRDVDVQLRAWRRRTASTRCRSRGRRRRGRTIPAAASATSTARPADRVTSRSMASHDAKRPSRTSDLSRWVAGRDGAAHRPTVSPRSAAVSRSRSSPTAISASTIPMACQRVTRSLSTTIASATVAAG